MRLHRLLVRVRISVVAYFRMVRQGPSEEDRELGQMW